MIRRIDHLGNFGLYRNFQWGGLTAFAKHNLIYGWNYSGKTTLARLFQILEKPELIAGWNNSTFSVVMNDGSAVTQTTLAQPLKVRVFNRDFVSENFVQEHTAPAVFILGAPNVSLRQRLEVLNRRRERVGNIETDLQRQATETQTLIDSLGTNKARSVGDILGDRAFRRPNLIRRVEEVRTDYAASILSDPDVIAKIEICRSTSVWVPISVISNELPDINAVSARIAAILAQTASNRAIARLTANRPLESWVRTGLELQGENRQCEFCGSTVTDARIEELKGHFSEEYEALVQEIAATIQTCQNLRVQVPLADERDFLPDLKAEFIGLREQFHQWYEWADGLRTAMIHALTQKQTRLETVVGGEVDLSRASEGNDTLAKINDLIQRHNVKVGQHAQTRTAARTALERHYAALLFREDDLLGKETRLKGLQDRVTEARAIRERLKGKIEAIELQVRQQSIGAAKLNGILRFLLTGNNIDVAVVGDGLFEFRRDGVQASHLSDGEKTAIAFAYFLTSLEANGAVLADTIVFIDDPISSLDSNHIYAVYALVSERLNPCLQIFLSTHNGELFNLMKDAWFNSRQQYANTPNSSAYYVSRKMDGNNQWIAILEDLPNLLRKYRSEYHFLFAQLHVFANNQGASLHEAYTAPNLVRKFLEAYLGFRKPCITKWSAKLDLLFPAPEAQREIQKFADDASHLHGLNRALQQPDFVASAQTCVGKVIAGLKAMDYAHYESLCRVIGVTP